VIEWVIVGSYYTKAANETEAERLFVDALLSDQLRWSTAHGLRKAGAVIAAHNGATLHQLMSIFGWQTLKEAERYTKAADQKRIASGAMRLLLSERTGNESG